MKIAVITGASSGIGKEFAKKLSTVGGIDELWLIARRKDLLEAISSELRVPCKIIALDLAESDSFDVLQ